jgi:hypothetical protein
MKSQLFIFIGGVENRDYDAIPKLAKRGGTARWSSTKSCKPGDRALIYVVKPCGRLLAKAKVLGTPEKCKAGSYKYRTMIGDFKLLPNQLTIQELKREFPRWGWLRYPRGKAVVPEQYADRLWKLVHQKPKAAQSPVLPAQGAGFGDAQTNRLVERAAVRKVMHRLRQQGYRVVSREKDRCGYDLEATKGRQELHVEVKGISGQGLQFPITKQEVQVSSADPAFRLVAVTQARTRKAQLWQFTSRQFKKAFRLTPICYMATNV